MWMIETGQKVKQVDWVNFTQRFHENWANNPLETSRTPHVIESWGDEEWSKTRYKAVLLEKPGRVPRLPNKKFGVAEAA